MPELKPLKLNWRLGEYICITFLAGNSLVTRFEEMTPQHLHCDRGKPIPLSNIKSIRAASPIDQQSRQQADEWNRMTVIPLYPLQ